MINNENNQPFPANAIITRKLFFWLKPLSDALYLPIPSPERWSEPAYCEKELEKWESVAKTIGAVYLEHFEGYTESGNTLLDLLSTMESEVKMHVQSTNMQGDRYQAVMGHLEEALEVIITELRNIDDQWIMRGYLNRLKSISVPTTLGDDFQIKLSQAFYDIEFYVMNIRKSLTDGAMAIKRAMPNPSQHSTDGQNVSNNAIITVSQPAGEPSFPSIYILPNARPALIDTLLPYVDTNQHNSLRMLICEEAVLNQPIICKCKQVLIGQIFYNQVKVNNNEVPKIQSPKTELAKWICQNFRLNKAGKEKKLTESTILNYLKNIGFGKKK